MNTVYYMLRNEFEADDTYTGSDIMKVVLKTIKVRTNLPTSRILNEQLPVRSQWKNFEVLFSSLPQSMS